MYAMVYLFNHETEYEIECGLVVSWFFFQAEDGIRDLVRSRGLGDVYKRQVQRHPVAKHGQGVDFGDGQGQLRFLVREPHGVVAVSYTHLTLPTSDLV